MSVGDILRDKNPAIPKLGRYPGSRAVGDAVGESIQTSYSYSQHAGVHVAEWHAPVRRGRQNQILLNAGVHTVIHQFWVVRYAHWTHLRGVVWFGFNTEQPSIDDGTDRDQVVTRLAGPGLTVETSRDVTDDTATRQFLSSQVVIPRGRLFRSEVLVALGSVTAGTQAGFQISLSRTARDDWIVPFSSTVWAEVRPNG